MFVTNNLSPTAYTRALSRCITTDGQTVSGLKFGVELEYEEVNLADVTEARQENNLRGWQVKRDNSLRGENAREFLFDGPANLENSKRRVSRLCSVLRKHPPSESERTSLHVHVNAIDWTFAELHRFLTIYYLLEKALVRRAGGQQREGNLFCLRLADCNPIATLVKRAFRKGDPAYLLQEARKYSALNFASLGRFGTLEFRFHRATTSDTEINAFLDVLAELVAVSRSFRNVSEILQNASFNGVEDFLAISFPQTLAYLRSGEGECAVMNLTDTLLEGVDLAQDIAFCVDIVDVPARATRRPSVQPLQGLTRAGRGTRDALAPNNFNAELLRQR